jgi:outer membrane lipoprotein carrier protein
MAAAIAKEDFRRRRKYIHVGCGRAVPGAHAAENPLLRSRLRPRKVFSLLALFLAVAISAPSVHAAAATTPLDSYLDNLKTLRATFLQTLADPHGREIDRATGTLIVSRPGKFSWEIHPQKAADGGAGPDKPLSPDSSTNTGQLMVCDGVNLWFLDRDLDQVTVKPVDAALSATPAMLLSGAVDVRKSFSVTPAGERMGLTWVLVEPRGAEADFRSALFGFAHDDLKRMILEDKLGQTATIIFEKIERNAPVPASEVSFTPPAGADVIGTPRK